MNTIYVYTTETYRDYRGWRKVGQTKQLAEDRVAQQDSTSNPEPLVIEETFTVEDSIEDHHIHKELERMGKVRTRDDKIREWFECSVDDVATAINNLRFGVARPNAYPMRDEQKECHDKAVAHFSNGGHQFLINAKMRFGKTFTAYQIMKSLDCKRVLILTYKPQVEAGWSEDLENHVDFEGWKYYYAKNFSSTNPVQFPGDTKEVLFASFQDLNDLNKTKWSQIQNYNFDLLVVDEQHYGLKTEKAQSTLDKIKFDKILEVSGTPLHALMSGKFLDNEIYSWTYSDEQRKRSLEKDTGWKTDIYRWLPVMKFMVFKISEDAKKQCSFYDDVEGFTMNKMFASDDGETFIDESAVTMWLEEAYGINCHKNKSPVKQYNSNHMVWKLPSVNSCRAMEKLLTRLDYVKHVPIVVSGDKGADLDGVKKHIKRNDKTITLTCGSLMTGTTVPQWDMIFMLDGGSSAQDYFQTIFRVQSSNKDAGKEMCYVVDYNPQRNLQMIYDFAFYTATSTSKNSVQKNIAEFLDFAPIMDHTGNTPVKKDVEEILDAIAHSTNALEKFGSGFNINFNNIDQDVQDILNPVKQDVNSKRSAEVNNNNIELGKNKSNTGNKGSNYTVDITVKEQRELQQKAVTVVKSVPNYLWLEPKKVDNIDDILYINNTEMFEREVGITIKGFEKLCNSQFINTKRVNECILAFQQKLKQY